MRFELKEVFHYTAEQVWAMFEGEAYEAKLAAVGGTTREVVEQREEAGEQLVRRRVTGNKPLPAAIAKLMGTERLVYEQETRRRRGAEVMRWSITPHNMRELFKASGSLHVRAVAEGAELTISGDLAILIPVVGRKLEAKLVEEMIAGQDKGMAMLRELLADAGASE